MKEKFISLDPQRLGVYDLDSIKKTVALELAKKDYELGFFEGSALALTTHELSHTTPPDSLVDQIFKEKEIKDVWLVVKGPARKTPDCPKVTCVAYSPQDNVVILHPLRTYLFSPNQVAFPNS